MKPKQVRNILSDATYPLSNQELKEYASPTTMQYCKVRALAKIMGLSLCQTKESLIRDVDHKTFFDCSVEKFSSKDLQKHYETEHFLHQRVSTEGEGETQEGVNSLPGYEEAKGLGEVFNGIWTIQKNKLGCEELYRALNHFTRPNMVFYNYLRNAPPSGSLTPIIYLPFTISTIPLISDAMVKKFTKYIGLFTQYINYAKYT